MPCKQGLETCDRYTGDPIVATMDSEIVQKILSSGLPVLEEEMEELCAAVRPKLVRFSFLIFFFLLSTRNSFDIDSFFFDFDSSRRWFMVFRGAHKSFWESLPKR